MNKERRQRQDSRQNETEMGTIENINKQQRLQRKSKYRSDRYGHIVGEVEKNSKRSSYYQCF